jgi:hypothetical protein
MRKNLLYNIFLWCFVLTFTSTIVAQDHSVGKAPANSDTKHQSNVVGEPQEAATTAYGSDALGVPANVLKSMPIPGGTPLTTIGSGTATLVQGGEFGPGGVYFGTQGNNTLITVDLTTGVFSTVAPISGVTGGQTITALAYYETTNTMYMGTTNITSSQVYTLNLTTGAATLIGTTGQPGLIGMAISCAGALYTYDLVQDNLWSINTTTGVGTVIGPIGFDANFCQDMDYDNETGTLYMAAYNLTTSTAQLRTVDVTTGMSTLVVDWGAAEFCSWAIIATCGPPCPVGGPTNPSPATGTTGLPLTGNSISWTNGANTTQNEIYFNGNLVYNGAAVTSRTLAQLGVEPLSYNTTYTWRVVCKDANCGTSGPTWTFTTMQDPLLQIDDIYCTDFTSGIGDWTITNEGGTCVWQQLTTTSNVYTLPATAQGNIMGADADLCGSGTTLLSTARLTNALNFAAQNYFYIEIKFDNDWRIIDAADEAHVELSTNGGSTWTSVWSRIGVDQRNSTEVIDVTSYAGQSSVQVRFRTVQPGWDWWWAVDNLCITGHWIVPVELTSFTAAAVGNNVNLNWTTATETNNQGFHIERSNGGEFTSVGFVAGHGTTTEIQNYSFVDRNVEVGSYSYRLKQVDYDGTFEYSDVVEIEIATPVEYSLDQNYPNPFNPSTKISFRLASDSKVSLKVFDVLGQEVMTLVNNELMAGVHNVDFDASGLNSGVYFYKIEASGNNGVQFSDVKKMILTK